MCRLLPTKCFRWRSRIRDSRCKDRHATGLAGEGQRRIADAPQSVFVVGGCSTAVLGGALCRVRMFARLGGKLTAFDALVHIHLLPVSRWIDRLGRMESRRHPTFRACGNGSENLAHVGFFLLCRRKPNLVRQRAAQCVSSYRSCRER